MIAAYATIEEDPVFVASAVSSGSDPQPASVLVRGRSMGGPGLDAAIALIYARPGVRVTLFEDDWSAVDRSRVILAAKGLDARIAVHHKWAWPLAASRDRHAA